MNKADKINSEIENIRIAYEVMAEESISIEQPTDNTKTTEVKTEEEIKEINLQLRKKQGLRQLDEGHRDFLHSLCEIEVFIAEVLLSNDPAFKLIPNDFGNIVFDKAHLQLKKYFKSVFKFSTYYEPGYKFSEHVQLFFDCWIALDLGKEGFLDPRRDSSRPGKKQFEVFNDLLELIRIRARSPEFRKKLSRRQEKSFRRYTSAKNYVNGLFDNCSRMQVVRIDLSYQHEVANRITVKNAKMDLVKFKNNWRGKPTLFKHLVGHIWKLEWAPGKGIHFHFILFFKSSEVLHDAYLAQQIGEYWNGVIKAKGSGIYWNCNARKYKYRRLGIGLISANDEEKRNILTEIVIAYLTKTEQYLRASKLGGDKSKDNKPDNSEPEDRKLFGHGEIKKKSPAGRRRKINA